jgi:hypothetical protein
MAILSPSGHIKDGEGQTVVSTSTSQPHHDAPLIYSHYVDPRFSNLNVELVTLIGLESKIGSKRVEKLFQNGIGFQALWAASSTNYC